MDKPGPKERILETASRLFHQQGYNSTGINQILEEAKVAKASLYQHFTSKDDLGVHYLQVSRQEWFAGLDQWTGKKKSALQKLLACFDFLEYAMQQNGFRGCKFINMLSEIGDTSPVMSKAILEHKARLRNYLKAFIQDALTSQSAATIDLTGDAIYLLFEGAIVESKIYKQPWPIQKARDMAKLLLSQR
ncbi:TetR/AcrR family transcriptional regulator [Paraflavitalea sp. CAU 1676]|uniref:TetR/AcrR family transcriptional regulator n=1 Tax=Paraflavitalea sp. CAU 1676 TaxID=3032598 RepID=UPI0023DA1ADC|nr:TetR/AcrR family transcriptional regulator [Paraflavitalea sp. CAU 1676]MDF2193776.1 TetR/AcrR family transcriptional regulator [Paraflavitalea sp. CAU 1676]